MIITKSSLKNIIREELYILRKIREMKLYETTWQQQPTGEVGDERTDDVLAAVGERLPQLPHPEEDLHRDFASIINHSLIHASMLIPMYQEAGSPEEAARIREEEMGPEGRVSKLRNALERASGRPLSFEEIVRAMAENAPHLEKSINLYTNHIGPLDADGGEVN